MSWLSQWLRKIGDAELPWARQPAPTVPVSTRYGATLADRIVRAMVARSYVIHRGLGELNIVYIEGCNGDGTPNANRSNAFDDRRLVLTFVNGEPLIVGSWEATTQTGTRYTLSPVKPEGAAIIELGQQKCWEVGLHRGQYEALVQTAGAVIVARDADKNYRRDGDKRQTGYFGINQHHAYDAPTADIGGHSAGCLVGRTIAGHREFMKLIKTDPRYKKGFVFHTTVMPHDWVR